ncbi:MAG: hypothetical protein ACK4PI_06690 [Tepidisphaerales bacterium]
MLPITLFERITAAYGLRTSLSPRERRGSVRVDIRGRALMCFIVGGMASTSCEVRLREISRSGLSILHDSRIRVGQELLLRLTTKDSNRFWLWCRCRRCNSADPLCNLVGMSISRVLLPGQDIKLGTDLNQLLWLDVEGEQTPEDPFAAAA